MSARTGDGVPELEAELAALLPEGPAYFEPGVDSDQPLERRIGELVREQALARTREEVPHAIAVVVDEVKAPRGKHAGRVTATLIVEAESQQGILVGKDGATVRAIGTAARPGIEELLGGQDLPRPARQGTPRLEARRLAAGAVRPVSARAVEDLARSLEATLVRPTALAADVAQFAARARELACAAVVVLPPLVATARAELGRGPVRVVAAVGLPFGAEGAAGDRGDLRAGGRRRRRRARRRGLAAAARQRRLPGRARRARGAPSPRPPAPRPRGGTSPCAP